MFKKFLGLFVVSALCVFICVSASSLFAQNGPGWLRPKTLLTTFETKDFSGSGVCAACHSRLISTTEEDVSQDAQWRSTMMANAAKDPLWLAKVNSEVVRNDHLKSIIEEKCASCHMGMATYQAATHSEDIIILNEEDKLGFLDPGHVLHEAAMDGVSCAICHQITEENLGEEPCFTGKYIIDTSSSPPDRQLFGPYAEPPPDTTMMENNSGFSPLYGGHLNESKLCSPCHTLYTPVVDGEGNPVLQNGQQVTFPEQTAYHEWMHSSFYGSKTCQDCHVPRNSITSVISNRPNSLVARTPYGQHHFVGGNSFMVGLLKRNSNALGVTADAPHLEDTIERTNTLLEQNTATLNSTAFIDENELTLEVTIENLAGHKTPTGIPIRRLWLHVTLVDAHSEVVFESGKPLPDGKIDGNKSDGADDSYDNGLMWEPHYDVIYDEDEVQIYEGIMLDTDGNVTQTLLRAYSYAKDNRLLPMGFDKHASGIEDFGVYGDAFSDDNFIGGQDLITYKIDVSDHKAPYSLKTELLFQAVSYPFINDFNADDVKDEELVGIFMKQYAKEDKTPVVVAMDEILVP